jgi:hypothetical protein
MWNGSSNVANENVFPQIARVGCGRDRVQFHGMQEVKALRSERMAEQPGACE